MRNVVVGALCAAAALAWANHGQAAVLYTVTEIAPNNVTHINDLGLLSAVDTNNLGHAAGFGASGTLGGDLTTYFGINESDQSVGTSRLANGESHGAIWTGGALHDLGSLVVGLGSDAYAINDLRLVVGGAYDFPGSQTTAVYWDDTGIHALPRLADSFHSLNVTRAVDVNNDGLIVGSSPYVQGFWEAVTWSGGAIQELGFLGTGTFSQALAVNDLGQIVGVSTTTINGSPLTHGFIWSDGAMQDLNDLVGPLGEGIYIDYALGINEQGQIVGTIRGPHNFIRAVRLDPIGVPEPSAWAMLILGFTSVGAMARRQRPHPASSHPA